MKTSMHTDHISALDKLLTVIESDAEENIRHEKLELEPKFYWQVLRELHGKRFTPELPPLRVTVYVSYGGVDIAPREVGV